MASAGRNEDSVKIMGFWHFFFVSRNPRNLRPESSSLVSTSPTHSGDGEDSEDSGIFSLFFCWNLRNLPTEPSSKTFASCTVDGYKGLLFAICHPRGFRTSFDRFLFRGELRETHTHHPREIDDDLMHQRVGRIMDQGLAMSPEHLALTRC